MNQNILMNSITGEISDNDLKRLKQPQLFLKILSQQALNLAQNFDYSSPINLIVRIIFNFESIFSFQSSEKEFLKESLQNIFDVIEKQILNINNYKHLGDKTSIISQAKKVQHQVQSQLNLFFESIQIKSNIERCKTFKILIQDTKIAMELFFNTELKESYYFIDILIQFSYIHLIILRYQFENGNFIYFGQQDSNQENQKLQLFETYQFYQVYFSKVFQKWMSLISSQEKLTLQQKENFKQVVLSSILNQVFIKDFNINSIKDKEKIGNQIKRWSNVKNDLDTYSLYILASIGIDCQVNENGIPDELNEDFLVGLNPKYWLVMNKIWGKKMQPSGFGPNGVVKELVKIQKDNVNGQEKNVLVLQGQGDECNIGVNGLKKIRDQNNLFQYSKDDCFKRVGSCISTFQRYGAGKYEVVMKFGTEQDPYPQGSCISLWSYAYFEHYKSQNVDTQNEYDPFFKDRFACKQYNMMKSILNTLQNKYVKFQLTDFNQIRKIKIQQHSKKKLIESGEDYSIDNHEIDGPELGHLKNQYYSGIDNGKFQFGQYTTYHSELGKYTNSKSFPLGINVIDGKYHTWTYEWKIILDEEKSLTKENLIPFKFLTHNLQMEEIFVVKGNSSVEKQFFPQGEIVIQRNNTFYLYKGIRVSYYLDNKLIGEQTEHIPFIAGRFNLGIWFPHWVGIAPWKTNEFKISSIKIIPDKNQFEAGLYIRPETYPIDGLLPIHLIDELGGKEYNNHLLDQIKISSFSFEELQEYFQDNQEQKQEEEKEI